MTKSNKMSEHKGVLIDIGKRLKYLMKKKDVTILQLSRDLNVSRNKIGKMLSGEVNFTIISLNQMLDYFEISIEHFFRIKI